MVATSSLSNVLWIARAATKTVSRIPCCSTYGHQCTSTHQFTQGCSVSNPTVLLLKSKHRCTKAPITTNTRNRTSVTLRPKGQHRNTAAHMCEVVCRSPFGSAPGAGSCGLYSGTDKSDASTVIVPTAMRAAVVTTNPDFAGSCGRYLM